MDIDLSMMVWWGDAKVQEKISGTTQGDAIKGNRIITTGHDKIESSSLVKFSKYQKIQNYCLL